MFIFGDLRTTHSSQYWSFWHCCSATPSTNTVLRLTSTALMCGASSWTTCQQRLRAHRNALGLPGMKKAGKLEAGGVKGCALSDYLLMEQCVCTSYNIVYLFVYILDTLCHGSGERVGCTSVYCIHMNIAISLSPYLFIYLRL